MAGQLAFLLGLHILGIFLFLPFRNRIPIAFIGLSGFLWGMLLWILSVLFWLVVIRTPVIPGAVGVLVVLALGIIFINVWRQTWQMSLHDWLWCLLPSVGFLIVGISAAIWNRTAQTPDSFSQIFLANTIATEGLISLVATKFLSWGPGLPFLHVASYWVGSDYLYMLQPLTGYIFCLTWVYLVNRAFYSVVMNRKQALGTALVLAAVLFSSWGMLFQYFYVHNSLYSAAYLFTAVSALWLSIQEKDDAWLWVAAIAMIGFGLFRREAPLVALTVFVVLLAQPSINWRARALTVLLPTGFIFLFLGWVWGLNPSVSGGDVFSSRSVLMQIMALGAAIVYILSAWRIPVFGRLLPYLPKLMLVVLGLATIAGTIWNPWNIWLSLHALGYHLFISDWWSLVVITSAVLLLISPREQAPHAMLFIYPIVAFFLLILVIRPVISDPFRIGPGDSGNRMLTYIFPIFMMYVGLKLMAIYPLIGQSVGNHEQEA